MALLKELMVSDVDWMEIHVVYHGEVRCKVLKWAKMMFSWKNWKARLTLLPYWKRTPFLDRDEEWANCQMRVEMEENINLFMFMCTKVWKKYKSNPRPLFREWLDRKRGDKKEKRTTEEKWSKGVKATKNIKVVALVCPLLLLD